MLVFIGFGLMRPTGDVVGFVRGYAIFVFLCGPTIRRIVWEFSSGTMGLVAFIYRTGTRVTMEVVHS